MGQGPGLDEEEEADAMPRNRVKGHRVLRKCGQVGTGGSRAGCEASPLCLRAKGHGGQDGRLQRRRPSHLKGGSGEYMFNFFPASLAINLWNW